MGAKRTAGRILLAVAALAIVGGGITWIVETNLTEVEQSEAEADLPGLALYTDSSTDLADSLAAITAPEIEPNRTPSIALFVLGALSALGGVALIAGPQEGPLAVEAAASPRSPDVSSQLADLAGLKSAGHLSEQEFERAKRQVLGGDVDQS